MKRSTLVIIIIIPVLAMLAALIISNNKRDKRKERAVLLNSANENFPSYDSAYTINDTMFFYRNDSFIGKSITVTE